MLAYFLRATRKCATLRGSESTHHLSCITLKLSSDVEHSKNGNAV